MSGDVVFVYTASSFIGHGRSSGNTRSAGAEQGPLDELSKSLIALVHKGEPALHLAYSHVNLHNLFIMFDSMDV